MGLAGFLNHGFNLPFLVMLGLAAVFVMLQAIGFVGHGDSDVDIDHDVDVDADADADADVDHDVDADADGHAAFGAQSALAFFGIGRVPFMVVWLTLFIFSGISGIFLNGVVFSRFAGDYPGWAFPIVCAASLAIGLVAVRLFSRVAARLVDVGGRGAVAKHELAGRVGVVASSELGPSSKGVGEIRVRDDRGNELLLHARVDGAEATLRRGDEVLLVDYDAENELFLVTSDTDGLGPAKARTTRTTKN